MSFGDERDEPSDHEPTPRRIKWNTVELDQVAKAKLRASSMAAFCASIPAEDWILLQQISARTRVGLLQRCLRMALQARNKAGARLQLRATTPPTCRRPGDQMTEAVSAPLDAPIMPRQSLTMADIFHYDEGRKSFDDLAVPNGTPTWREADLMEALGYQSKQGFRSAVTRAMQACLALGIALEENFIMDGGDYRFTRFACYLVAMNADPKKQEVATAQVYFAAMAETFQSHIEHAQGIDRVLIRDEMTSGLKTLDGTAKRHGVENYAFFLNQGYRGMYNMDLGKLKEFKRIGPKEQLLDRMGKDELAANLFRITQTEAKIKNDGIHGQRGLEFAAHEVGRTVRQTMMKISGTAPEHLPIAAPIAEVKKKLKGASKRFKELDGPKKKKRTKALPPKSDE